MKLADMDVRLAVVLFTAVVCFSTNAGMNCLNSLFSVILIYKFAHLIKNFLHAVG